MMGIVMDATEYPPFGVTADLVILTVREGRLCVALVERRSEPFRGRLALPGGFVSRHGLDRTLEDTALRELREETGIPPGEVHLEQLKTYWTRGRDPRQEVVTVAWLALGPIRGDLESGSDAASADWYTVEAALGLPLAFDHNEILRDGVERARAKLEYTDVAATFFPREFTIGDVRRVYEAIWGIELDPGNFQRKMTGVFERVPDAVPRNVGRGDPPRSSRANRAAFATAPGSCQSSRRSGGWMLRADARLSVPAPVFPAGRIASGAVHVLVRLDSGEISSWTVRCDEAHSGEMRLIEEVRDGSGAQALHGEGERRDRRKEQLLCL